MMLAAKLMALDIWDAITGARRPMTPSRLQAWKVGAGDFHTVGEHLAQLLIGPGALGADDTVLDVACGIGRAAVPLTRYLTARGKYIGFDLSRPAIDWCRRHIKRRHPNFSFVHVDVMSRHYNPYGSMSPEQFVFPCDGASIDVALLASILTHLAPDAAARYVAETARVLKPGGRAVMTFFLIDDDNRAQLPHLSPSLNAWPQPWYAVHDAHDPEAAIGFERSVVERALNERGLQIEVVSKGRWVRNPDAMTYQDLIVCRRVSGS